MGNSGHSWILRRSSPLWRMRSLQQPPVVEAGLRVHQAKFMHSGIFCFILSRKIWTWNETHLLTLSPSQSARTIIIILKTWVGLWPWKKGPKYGLQKARCKKAGSLLFSHSKREEARLPALQSQIFFWLEIWHYLTTFGDSGYSATDSLRGRKECSARPRWAISRSSNWRNYVIPCLVY